MSKQLSKESAYPSGVDSTKINAEIEALKQQKTKLTNDLAQREDQLLNLLSYMEVHPKKE